MSNIIHCIRTLGIVCILGVMLQSNCYARFVTTVTEIRVKCSPTPEEAQPQIYPGEPNSYLNLATKGIMVDGKDELVTNRGGQNNDLFAIAACIAIDENSGEIWRTQIRDVLRFPEHNLECRRGEGIEVTMLRPNDIDPDKYQYVANLITDYQVKNHIRKSRSIIPSPPPINVDRLDINTSVFTHVHS